MSTDINAVFEQAGFMNEHVEELVRHWAEITRAARVRIVSAADDAACEC